MDWSIRVKKFVKINAFKKYFDRFYFKFYLKNTPIGYPEYKIIYNYKKYLRKYKKKVYRLLI